MQTGYGTSCTANSVQIVLTWTDGTNTTHNWAIYTTRTDGSGYGTSAYTFTAATSGSIGRSGFFEVPGFAAKSGTAVSFSTANYTATTCSPNWTYTIRPLLFQDAAY